MPRDLALGEERSSVKNGREERDGTGQHKEIVWYLWILTVSSHPAQFSPHAPTHAVLSHPGVLRTSGRRGAHWLGWPLLTSPSPVKYLKERCRDLIRQGLALLHLVFACRAVWTALMWTAASQLWIFSCHRNALELTLNLYHNGPWWLDS